MLKYIFCIVFIILTHFGTAQNIKTYVGKQLEYTAYLMNDKLGNGYCSVDSIIVSESKGQKLRQKIIVPENLYSCSTINNPLNIEDWNFDGYEDISISTDVETSPNASNYVWLFNPQNRKFIRNISLERIVSAEIDSVNKRIISSWRSNAATYGEAEYKWIGSRLVLVFEKEIRYVDENDDTYVIIITKKPVKGKLKVVARKKLKRSQVTKDDTVWY